MRLLLAESDIERGYATQAALSRAGYATDWVLTGRHMQSALSAHRYDCAVLGLPITDVPRDELLPSLHRREAPLPVILVTGAAAVEDRVAMLDQGVDDCLVRPFHFDELTARIRSLMRRSRAEVATEDPMIHGSMQLDARCCTVNWPRSSVKLTHSEFAVLETLFRKRHQIVSRAQIEESLYGWGEEISSNAVEVYVHYLRRKLYPGLIVTVRGLGYQLSPDPV